MLRSKAALVTGSMSRFGLDIAQSTAQRGAHVLNGFGEASQTRRECDDVARGFGVGVAFGLANVSKSADVCGMIGQSARDLRLGCFTRERRGKR